MLVKYGKSLKQTDFLDKDFRQMERWAIDNLTSSLMGNMEKFLLSNCLTEDSKLLDTFVSVVLKMAPNIDAQFEKNRGKAGVRLLKSLTYLMYKKTIFFNENPSVSNPTLTVKDIVDKLKSEIKNPCIESIDVNQLSLRLSELSSKNRIQSLTLLLNLELEFMEQPLLSTKTIKLLWIYQYLIRVD